MEKAGSSWTMALMYPTAECQIPEGHALNIHCCSEPQILH